MLRMDMSRIQQVGILRHAKGAKEEMMMDFAQPTVIEHELVRIKHDTEVTCQVDIKELDGGDDITLMDITKAKDEKKDEQRKEELDEWVKSKKLYDTDDVQIVDSTEDKKLAPNDEIIRDSPRKTNTARISGRGQLSVRIIEPNEVGIGMGVTQFIGAGEGATKCGISSAPAAAATLSTSTAAAPGVASVKKGSDAPPTPQQSRPSSSEDTARLTVVPKYGESSDKEAHTSREGTSGGGDADENSNENSNPTPSISSNPFSDAFSNVPEMAATAPPEQILDTTRTGISEMSDNINNPGWTVGIIREWKRTKLRDAAAELCQSFVRMVVVAPLKVERRKKEMLEEEDKMKEIEAKEEDEIDHEFNELVDENTRLGEQNISMTYELERMKKQLEEMKNTARAQEDEDKHHGEHKEKK